MNFEFDINGILPLEITKFNSNLKIIYPDNFQEDEKIYQLNRDQKQKLAFMIDKIGEGSSKAQGLKDIITSYRKLNLNDQHRIYLMKDSNGNNGKGSLVGMLKVGEKHLFVYDNQGQQNEMNPLCVLDFYVCDNQQRKGYGRSLFDYMIQSEMIKPEHLAIDSPSEKSMRFLKKHYNLKNPINQVNNFVVFAGFFENRSQMKRNNRRYDANSANAHLNRSEFPPLPEQKVLFRSDSLDSKYRSRTDFSNQQQLQQFQNVNTFQQPYSALPSSQQYTDTQMKQQTFGNMSSNLFNSKSASSVTDKSSPNTSLYFTNQNNNLQNLNNNLNNNNNKNKNPDDYLKSENGLKQDYLFKSNTNVDNYNYSKTGSFYDSVFSQNNKYSPFPSLNPFNNKTNLTNLNTKPPLPPPLPPSAQLITSGSNVQRNNTNFNLTYHDRNIDTLQNENSLGSKNPFITNNNQSKFEAFPSLNSLKTTGDLYSNQFYMSSKFRRTKLW